MRRVGSRVLTGRAEALGLERSRHSVLPELLARSARRHPDTVALVFERRRLTFAQLDERCRRLANALAQHGVGAGDRVAVLMYNRLELVESLFACQMLGACPVPVSFRLVQAEVDHILADCGAVGVIADEPLAERAAAAAARLPTVRFHLAVGAPPAGAVPYEDVLAAAPGDASDAMVTDDTLALLMYTSGTTGRPKGAMLAHRNLVANTINWVHELRARREDVWLAGLPLFHIGAINGILPFIYLGATAVITPSTQFDAAESVALLRQHRVTMCFFVPTQWDAICALPEAGELAAAGLRTAMWGASPAQLPTLQRMARALPGVDMVSAFGQTEMSSNTTFLHGADAIRKIGSVGRPAINVEVRIVDDGGVDVPRGDVGEIVYRGPTVMQGYVGNAAATADAFDGGWFHSGDLVREDEEGFIYVVDRKKDMIISGGENVYPAEVEAVLLEHPAVAEVAVVGVAHEKWVETPLAFVVREAGAVVTQDDLLEHCRAHLAGYKKPSAVAFVDALPRNASGKVLKRELRAAHDSARQEPVA